jgi:hypothetical protein
MLSSLLDTRPFRQITQQYHINDEDEPKSGEGYSEKQIVRHISLFKRFRNQLSVCLFGFMSIK